jgi:hypothetical protein
VLRHDQTRTAAFHIHGDELVQMDETGREPDQAELEEVAVVRYRCSKCDVEVAVGVMTSERDLEPHIVQ